jgi:carboxylesterase
MVEDAAEQWRRLYRADFEVRRRGGDVSSAARKSNVSVTMILELPKEMRLARQPFLFEGKTHGHIGVLCLHGFTGSPAEMRPLGSFLAECGYTALGPVLPQHGGLPHELKGVKWRAWAQAAHSALDQLAARCEHVFVAGLSMGGLLTLHLAACECHRAPEEGRRTPVRGIVVMAAPAGLQDSRAGLVRFGRFVMPYYYPLKNADFSDPDFRATMQRRIGNGHPVDLDDPRVQEQITRSVRIPLGAIHELLQLNAVVKRELPRVRVPALFIQGRKDRTITPDSADALAAQVGSQDKRVIWYENSAHELPLEPDAPAMFDEIQRFISQRV